MFCNEKNCCNIKTEINLLTSNNSNVEETAVEVTSNNAACNLTLTLEYKTRQETESIRSLKVYPPNNANLSRTFPEDADIPSTSNSVERNTTGNNSSSTHLQKLELERMCKLCKRRFATNLPSCGHLGLCDSCLSLAKKCPVCKKSFVKYYRVQARAWNEINFLNTSLQTLREHRDDGVEDDHSDEVASFSPSPTPPP